MTELPKGSGPLDFAYSIHTDIGEQNDWCQNQWEKNGPIRLQIEEW